MIWIFVITFHNLCQLCSLSIMSSFYCSVKQISGCRNYCWPRKPYVPWRNLDVLESIHEELSQPPREVIPLNPVKRTNITNPVNKIFFRLHFSHKSMIIIILLIILISIFQAHHTYNDVGKFYTIPEVDIKHYFQLGGIPKGFAELSKAFNESCVMIRKPFLELRDYIIQANYSKIPVKYVICILFYVCKLIHRY